LYGYLDAKNKEFNSIETSPKFQSLLNDSMSSVKATHDQTIQQLNADKASLQAIVDEEKKKISLLEQEVTSLKSLSSSSAPPAGTNSTTVSSSEVEQSLKNEISSLQAQITTLQEQLAAASASSSTAPSSEGDAAGGDKKFTEEDIKGMISDIYGGSCSMLMSKEELNAIEDESLRSHTVTVMKTILKRLKEILRQVTVDRLG
jgi:predicted RNase H-like nuclease (RuvC/YqgF family)